MDPDFASLEFPRFKREDDVTDTQKGDAAKAPAQDKPTTPTPAPGIPWIGSLMGGIPALDLPDEDEATPAATATTTETPATPAAPAKGEKPAKGSGVTVNVFPGAKGKTKTKPAKAPEKGDGK